MRDCDKLFVVWLAAQMPALAKHKPMGEETADDMDLLLVLSGALQQQDEQLSDVCRAVFGMLVAEAWRIAMRSHHYLTTQCLDPPSESAWMILYRHGNDLNFLNATSLTR
ncbi:hypothetical protein PInf_005174 [Phytophthora infestans]|nr:hypothetical protein PInf_005174 [Phytophthora infestans]